MPLSPEHIIEHLPFIMRDTAPRSPVLRNLIDSMHGMLRPAEARLEELDRFFTPRQAPPEFVTMLAGWLALDHLFDQDEDELRWPTGIGCLRELISSASELRRWRGTRYGLQRFLVIATGIDGFHIEESGADDPQAFHMHIDAPAAAAQHYRLVDRIIASEKPAYVTCTIRYRAVDTERETADV